MLTSRRSSTAIREVRAGCLGRPVVQQLVDGAQCSLSEKVDDERVPQAEHAQIHRGALRAAPHRATANPADQPFVRFAQVAAVRQLP